MGVTLMINYKVTYHNDCGAWVDPNPTVKIFDLHDEMEDWIMEEVQRRVDDIVQNSFGKPTRTKPLPPSPARYSAWLAR